VVEGRVVKRGQNVEVEKAYEGAYERMGGRVIKGGSGEAVRILKSLVCYFFFLLSDVPESHHRYGLDEQTVRPLLRSFRQKSFTSLALVFVQSYAHLS
jgi:hypothetical protein